MNAKYEQNRILQENSKIPMLIAANTEAGGNGACTDGTYVGWEIKVAASGDDEKYAYELGRISGVEASAIGCNWSFAPIVDLYRNWRNPIVSVRTWSADPDQTIKLAKAYMKGIMESNIMPAAKHWPGDGIDERDQHLSSAPNWYDTKHWDETFGKVYKALIDEGLPSIMAGHIGLPSYQKELDPDSNEFTPATLSHALTTTLLREKLGFNGVVVTDASRMVGMTGFAKRRDILPMAINAGCDLFLFFNDPDEDFNWMMEAYNNGVLGDERLEEALTRTLGLKARIGLHKLEKTKILPPKDEAMARIKLPENVRISEELSDAAVTLVKDQDEGVLPISPEKFKRIGIIPISGPKNPMAHGKGPKGVEVFADVMRERGYDVELYESLTDKSERMTTEEFAGVVKGAYAGKAPISAITDKYDMVISVAQVNGLMQPTERVYWPASKGTLVRPRASDGVRVAGLPVPPGRRPAGEDVRQRLRRLRAHCARGRRQAGGQVGVQGQAVHRRVLRPARHPHVTDPDGRRGPHPDRVRPAAVSGSVGGRR
ncbi:glycoside hydrolase family 3 protein [Nigerium massiliense]|uniref:glycoside hydrolase family 3 protein n=1 Tax=Nigerium massiliense TaxID=1522317 RepID=UPI000694B952|nr:glycoside hydrolase family 3 N-terminal domain-containing protein [Nigerium massiliense]